MDFLCRLRPSSVKRRRSALACRKIPGRPDSPENLTRCGSAGLKRTLAHVGIATTELYRKPGVGAGKLGEWSMRAARSRSGGEMTDSELEDRLFTYLWLSLPHSEHTCWHGGSTDSGNGKAAAGAASWINLLGSTSRVFLYSGHWAGPRYPFW